MIMLSVLLFVSLANGVINGNVHEEISDVEALVKKMTQHSWSDDEEACRDAVVSMLHGVRNSSLWATWMWDSMQRPSGTLYGSLYHLGNYDQCLNPPWPGLGPQRSQYCLLEVQLSEGEQRKSRNYFDPYETTDVYMNTKSGRGRHMNVLTWGLCLPSQCSAKSVTSLARLMAQTTHLAPMGRDPGIRMNYCHLEGEVKNYGVGTYMFVFTLLTFVIVAILCTYYGEYAQPDSFVSKFAKSFCIKTNYEALFQSHTDEISAMNGIRFLTAAIVVFAHVLMFILGIGVVNGLDADRDMSSFNGIFIFHMDIIVDTFFTLSGILHVKCLLSNKSGKPQSFIKIIIQRYVRLTAAFAVAVFYLTTASTDVGNGPLWDRYAGSERSICLKSWWKCLLMLTLPIGEMCYVISWYIPVDFHLTVIGTTIFFIYKNNRKNAFKLFGIVCLLSILIPGFITYWYKLNAVVISTFQDLVNLRLIRNVDYVYTKVHSRAGPYMVGMAMGYLINTCNAQNYKKVIPKIWSLLGTLLALSVMLFISSLGIMFDPEQFTATVPISLALDRVVWATAVSSILGICIYGDFSLVNGFLSWSIFRPLGRLSYGIYLFHSIILHRCLFSTRAPLKFDYFYFGIIGAGTTAMSTLVSLLVWLFVEAPIINFTNHLLRSKSNKRATESNNGLPASQNGCKNGKTAEEIRAPTTGHAENQIHNAGKKVL